MKVKIKRVKDGKIPTKKHAEDACYDMYAREITFISQVLMEIKLGVSIQPPIGWRVAIYPRSSISTTGWILANSVGIGDQNYLGEYKAYFLRVDNHSLPPYKRGDRVCQMELVPYHQLEFVEEELTDTDRGEGGFGSTDNVGLTNDQTRSN